MTPTEPPRQETRLSLIESLQTGANEGWARLLRLYEPLIVFWTRRHHMPDRDISDICQDVYRVVTERVGEFQHQRTGSFRRWLREITHHVCLEQTRKNPMPLHAPGGTEAQLRLQELPDTATEDDPPEQIGLLLDRVLELVQSEFSDRDWQIFNRLVIDTQPIREVASEFGLNEPAIRQIKSRIFHRLRLELGDHLDGESGVLR